MSATVTAAAALDGVGKPAAVATAVTPGRPARARRAWFELTVPLSALAVLLVAVAFSGGRAEPPSGSATRWFWAGQILLVATVAVASVNPRVTRRGRFTALVVFTAAQYAIKWMYSPLQFKFADELQHWQTTLGMLDTNQLFPENASLPISPVFPGLELITVTVMRVSGLAFFPAAVLVCGLCTLLATGAVWALASRVAGRSDVAAVVCLIYLLNPNHGFFSSMYLYVTPALPFLFLLVLKTWDVARRRPARSGGDPSAGDAGRADGRLALLSGLALLVTHHVTVLFGLVAVLAIGVTALATPALRPGRDAVWKLAGQLLAATLVWIGWVATGAVNYVRGPIEQVLDTLTTIGSGTPIEGPRAVTAARPPVETLISVAAVGVICAGLGIVGLVLFRHRRWRPGLLTWIAGAVMGVLVIARALGTAAELVGRSFPYVTLAAALALGYGLTQALDSEPRGDRAAPVRARRSAWRLAGVTGGVAALVVVGLGGITTGIPAFWQRIPGTFHPAGFESSIDARTMDLAWWARRSLPRGTRFAADLGNEAATGSVGGLHAVHRAAPLFYRDGLDLRDREWTRLFAVHLFVVDRRLTIEPPVTGSYFSGAVEPGRYSPGVRFDVPIPAAALDKFAGMTDLGILYDDGQIRVYDTEGSRYAW